MRSQILTLCLVTGLGIFFSDSLLAQLPTDFYDELWDNDYDRLTGIAFDEEGRGFTWERNGLVYRLNPDGERLPTPLLDIREEVADWSDMGMVGARFTLFSRSNEKFHSVYLAGYRSPRVKALPVATKCRWSPIYYHRYPGLGGRILSI